MAARRAAKLKDHVVLALDIGSRFIKVAEMRLARGSVSLLNVAVGPTPPGLVDNNQILDPTYLGRAVRELLMQNKIRSKGVVVAISGQSSVVVRPIDLPKMSTKELAETMKFEVERHIPFAVDEVVMDYAPIVPAEELPESESNMKVLLAVAHEDLIKNYIKMIGAAGLHPVAMDVEILAAMRALIDINESAGGYEQTVALVNIGAGSTDISIVSQGNLSFTRSVPIAGDTLTEAIADQLGRSFDEAEDIKREHARIFMDTDEAQHPMSAPGPLEAPAPEAAPAEPVSLMEGFASFSPTDAAPAAAPSNIFSLDGDFTTPGPVQMTAPAPTAPAPKPQPAPVAPAPSNTFLMDDDDVDDEMPIMRLSLDDEEPEMPIRNVPVFDLDGDDDVDDDIPMIPIVKSEPARPAAAPVFDISAPATPAPPPPPAAPPPLTPTLSLSDNTEDSGIFGIDDEVDIPPPAIFSLDDEPEPAPAAPTPAFDLGGPALTVGGAVDSPVFDFSSELEAEKPAVPTFTPSAPEPAAAPVFDFSSELEEQMPAVPRSQFADDATPEPLPSPSTIDAGSLMSAMPTFETTASFDPSLEEAPATPAPAASFSAPGDASWGMDDLGLPAATPGDDLLSMSGTGFQATTTLDAVPALDRADAAQEEVYQRRLFESMMPSLVELVTEIRRSLEFYSSREPDHPIERIVLYGGTSRMPNLTQFIHQEIGVEVVIADPLQAIDVSACLQPVEYLQDIAPALPIVVGLGLRDMLA
jgi:type IV pilus assembly protein PilM